MEEERVEELKHCVAVSAGCLGAAMSRGGGEVFEEWTDSVNMCAGWLGAATAGGGGESG